jgi:alpha-1,3-rhamnosyl/mannosyltransferase
MPEMHTPANVRVGRLFAERVMRPASGLIAISESTRNDAVGLLGLDARKITVIYPGVSAAYFNVSAEEGRAVAAQYGLRKPYVLFVGTVEPRKNLRTLVEAWDLLPEDLRAAFEMAVAGSGGWGDPDMLMRLRAGIPGVRYLGYVPEREMPGLTAAATLFAYPSLYEGFGLPVAQALAARVPVVTSNVSSLPEVAARGGVLVDPRSPAETAAALARLLENPELRQTLAAEGAAHARRFTWETAAAQSWEWFRTVAGKM